MSDEDDEEERRRKAAVDPLPRSQTRPPDQYALLKDAAELAPFQSQLRDHLATTPNTPIKAPIVTLRDDNAALSVERAAKQLAETRKDNDAKVDKQALENAAALTRVAGDMRSVSNRFETLGQDPLQILEEKRLTRGNANTRDGESYFQNTMAGQRASGDPFEKLERAAGQEYAAFCRDRENLQAQIANERDLTTRTSLERQRDLHAANYLAATSHRLADQWEVVFGSRNYEDASNARARALAFEAEAEKLQDKYRLYTESTARTDEATIARQNEEALRVRESSSGRFDSSAIERESRQPNTYDGPAGNVEVSDAMAKRIRDRTTTSRSDGVDGKDWAYVDGPVRTGNGRGGRTS